jgi:hypothetical protein
MPIPIPDPNPNFHYDANSNPDSDWHQNYADPQEINIYFYPQQCQFTRLSRFEVF